MCQSLPCDIEPTDVAEPRSSPKPEPTVLWVIQVLGRARSQDPEQRRKTERNSEAKGSEDKKVQGVSGDTAGHSASVSPCVRGSYYAGFESQGLRS